jgi:hypothetical protein
MHRKWLWKMVQPLEGEQWETQGESVANRRSHYPKVRPTLREEVSEIMSGIVRNNADFQSS